ncbi:MAG: MMPL family transporter [Cycloclasticus sp.]
MTEVHSKAGRVSARIANWVVEHRKTAYILVLLPSLLLAYSIPSIEIFSRFSDLLPQQHEYVKNYNRMKEVFGGANVITMSLESKKGDLFTKKTLDKVKYLTEQVDLISGVNHYQVASIAHAKIRVVKTNKEGMVISRAVLPREVPSDIVGLKTLKEEILNNPIVYGTYVSKDGSSALITAGFDEKRLDYEQIHTRLSELKNEIEKDGETLLHIAGEPMLKGWIYSYSEQLYQIFFITFLIIIVLLFMHFRAISGVFIPVFCTLLSAVWGLGLVGWMDYNLDPLILVVPILISARTTSHCVQLIERFQDERRNGASPQEAVRTSMGELMIPAFIAIFTDAAGLLVLSVSSIPMISKLGVYCSFWSLSNIVTVSILVPLLLLSFPVPIRQKAGKVTHSFASNFMGSLGRFLVSGKSTIPVTVLVIVILMGGFFYGGKVTVGENKPGSPLLFEHSEYNQAAQRISEKFAGANQLSIYIEGEEAHVVKRPDVAKTMEAFIEHMQDAPKFGGTRDLPTLVRSVNRLYHYDDPRWYILPNSQKNIGNTLFMYEAGAAVPGVIQEYMDLEGRRANFVVYFKDATGSTVDAAIERAKEFIETHPLEGVKYYLAGGIIGVTAASNEEVEYSELMQTVLILMVVMVSVIVTYQSFVAALFVFVVLFLAIVINRAYMGFREIGLNINTLPVTAVGIGIGVDYVIYVIDRIKEEYHINMLKVGDKIIDKTKELNEAIITTLRTTGAAVVFTAVTVVGGIVYWIPGSALRFNSEMAILLILLMVSNMIGAITIVPLLIRVLKPKFLAKGLDKKLGQKK